MSYLPPYSHSKSKIEVKLPSTANVATVSTVENLTSVVWSKKQITMRKEMKDIKTKTFHPI